MLLMRLAQMYTLVEKTLNLVTIDGIDLKCDAFDESVVNRKRNPIFFTFILDRKPDYKLFC